MIISNENTAPAVELADVCKSFDAGETGGDLVVNHLSLKIKAGEFFTFLGPSGCGKTTSLRMIAGFEQPTKGMILLAGSDVTGLPAHRRNVNTVFQSYALFPHLNVEENVAFGLSVKRVPRAETAERVRKALELVRMGHALKRKPSELSGGQQQRVALARALVNEPSVLLLDEPFGALDLKLRREMQFELKEMQRRLNITFVFVTHDQEEALTMSDRIAVMEAGRVHQVGDPTAIYEQPSDAFTASFIGEMNMLPAKVTKMDAKSTVIETGSSRFSTTEKIGEVGTSVTLAVRPESMQFGAPLARSDFTLKGKLQDVVYVGADRRCLVRLPDGQRVVVRLQNAIGRAAPLPEHGGEVTLNCPASAVRILRQ